jgi:hypothetical protein
MQQVTHLCRLVFRHKCLVPLNWSNDDRSDFWTDWRLPVFLLKLWCSQARWKNLLWFVQIFNKTHSIWGWIQSSMQYWTDCNWVYWRSHDKSDSIYVLCSARCRQSPKLRVAQRRKIERRLSRLLLVRNAVHRPVRHKTHSGAELHVAGVQEPICLFQVSRCFCNVLIQNKTHNSYNNVTRSVKDKIEIA